MPLLSYCLVPFVSISIQSIRHKRDSEEILSVVWGDTLEAE